jgi:hypothetical protein
MLPLKFSKYFIYFFIIFGIFNSVHADELVEYHQNVRALGMGGLLIPYVEDGEALFNNPAALAKVKGVNWLLADIDLGINGLQLYNDMSAISSSGNTSYSQFYGKNIWARVAGRSVLYFPNFAFGVAEEALVKLRLQRPSFPEMKVTYTTDVAFYAGIAYPVSPYVSWGMALKQIRRTGTSQVIGVGTIAKNDTSTLGDSFKDAGIGYGIDTGIQYQLPLPFNPNLAFVWKDVGRTTFTKTAGTSAPSSIGDNLQMGMSWAIDLPGLDLLTGFEYRRMLDSKEQIGKKIHLGAEISLPFVDFRAGFNQGYTSYGLGTNLWLVRFDLASYSEELGVYPGQTIDRRIQFSMTMDFGFDPFFSLGDLGSSSKRRKVKQRR